MRPLTETDIRASMTNASPDDLRLLAVRGDIVLVDWDHIDFYAWRDPHRRGRGYIIVEVNGESTGIVLRAADGSPRVHASMCNLCHTMQPADQVTMFTARKAGSSEDSVGTYICADLSCHENVRLAAPLAPNEVRSSVDRRIDGTRHRTEAFVARVLDTAESRR